ncbi:MAG: hypothetical protein MI723_00110, partial [Caulobacterales bacterium]|nr:hypothetical protein [Caulobacterales bacterium]
APRLAVPIVFATGVYLSNALGVDLIPLLPGVAAGAVWLVIVWLGIAHEEHTALGGAMRKAQLVIQAIVVLAMGGAAIASLVGADLFPGWLAVKWLAFAWIALFAIGIEITFKPAVKDYVRLQTEGASEEVNASLVKNLQPVYVTVLAVYLGTMVAAYFGINKPF